MWCNNWLSEGQINKKIAEWVIKGEPKPGTTFGHDNTHKEGNPLRLLPSCCDRAIERLSAFTEHYLKSLTPSLPSFVKNTTHFINEIEELNKQGHLPNDALLFSWDVVTISPNIDSTLCIEAVRNTSESRIVKTPSIECITEPVKICLSSSNCQLDNISFLQQHGTALAVMPIWPWKPLATKPY